MAQCEKYLLLYACENCVQFMMLATSYYAKLGQHAIVKMYEGASNVTLIV